MENRKYISDAQRIEQMFDRMSKSEEFSAFCAYLQDQRDYYTARLVRERDIGDFRFVQGQISVFDDLVERMRPNTTKA